MEYVNHVDVMKRHSRCRRIKKILTKFIKITRLPDEMFIPCNLFFILQGRSIFLSGLFYSKKTSDDYKNNESKNNKLWETILLNLNKLFVLLICIYCYI